MSWNEICSVLVLAGPGMDSLHGIYEEAESRRPAGTLPFLTLDFSRKYYPLTGCPPSNFERIREVVRLVEECPAAAELAWMIHYGAFLRKPPFRFPAIPLPEKIFGDNAGMFQFLVAQSCLPLVEETMERRNIPVSYAHDIAKWLKGANQIFETGHNGLPGFNFSQIPWLRNYVDGRLFRIGRLEFLMHTPIDWLPAVFRNRETDSVIALCPDRWRFLPDGSRAHIDTPDSEAVFTSLKIRDGFVEGTPIRPDGTVLLGQTVRLDLNSWTPACTPWEIVPSVHIPGGGGMTPEAVKASLLEARRFFRTYFDRDIRLFGCCSWILNPDWETELPESNMVKFLREGYAFPGVEIRGIEGLFFVFGSDNADPLSFPGDNRMFEAFRRLLRSGKTLRTGGVFFLADKLDEYGTQYYRTHEAELPGRSS